MHSTDISKILQKSSKSKLRYDKDGSFAKKSSEEAIESVIPSNGLDPDLLRRFSCISFSPTDPGVPPNASPNAPKAALPKAAPRVSKPVVFELDLPAAPEPSEDDLREVYVDYDFYIDKIAQRKREIRRIWQQRQEDFRQKLDDDFRSKWIRVKYEVQATHLAEIETREQAIQQILVETELKMKECAGMASSSQERLQRQLEEIEKKRREIVMEREMAVVYGAILDCFSDCSEFYQKIEKKAEKIEVFWTKIKEIKNEADGVQSGKVEEASLRRLKAICNEMDELETSFKELVDAVQLEEKPKKPTPPPTPPAQVKSPERAAPSAVELESSIPEPFTGRASERAYREYTSLMTELEDLIRQSQAFQSDAASKTRRYQLQSVVNSKINTISSAKLNSLDSKLVDLIRLFNGERVRAMVGNAMVSTEKDPRAEAFCFMHTAKIMIAKGETEAARLKGHDKAVVFGHACILLWQQFPKFGNALLGQIFLQYPFLVPYHRAKQSDETMVQYHQALGYKVVESSTGPELEPREQFLDRISGVTRLLAAILASDLSRRPQQHPRGIQFAWTWMAEVLNMSPLPDITAQVLYEFLSTAGYRLMSVYRRQFAAILLTLSQDYLPLVEKVTPPGGGANVGRLKIFLEQCFKKGTVPPPESDLFKPGSW